MKKVVIFCQGDYAGSAYQVVKAINSIGRIQARQVVCNKHPYEYDTDILLPANAAGTTRVNDCDRYEEARQVLSDADLVHTWNNELPDFYGGLHVTRGFRGNFPSYMHKYKSCTMTGTWYRIKYPKINKRLQANSIRLVVQESAFIMPSIDSVFIPHAIDTDKLIPLPIDQRDANTIGCYPHSTVDGNTANKDIAQLKNILKDKYPDWQVVLEQTGNNADRLKCLAKCVFFMQNMFNNKSTYGRSTIEALSLGVPVINLVHPDLHKYMDDIPIIHATPEILEESIENALNCDYSDLVKRSRDWVIKYHGYQTIGEQYTKFFEEIL